MQRVEWYHRHQESQQGRFFRNEDLQLIQTDCFSMYDRLTGTPHFHPWWYVRTVFREHLYTWIFLPHMANIWAPRVNMLKRRWNAITYASSSSIALTTGSVLSLFTIRIDFGGYGASFWLSRLALEMYD